MALSLETLEVKLQQYSRRSRPAQDHVAAAVLLPLFVKGGEDHLLFTKRTETVRDHKGQICFPGGAVEAEDDDLCQTALREAHEEVGILPADVRILGCLDDVVTHTGFHITPWVGRIPYPYIFQPDPSEVAEVLTVPLSDLLDPANVSQGTSARAPGVVVHFFRSGPHTIWGITGWILKNFLDVAFP